MKKTLVSVAATAVLSSSFVSYASASTHKVESGDSLWLIANKYDTSVSNLKSWNKLQSEMIFPNQVLKVAAGGAQAPQAPAPPKQNTGQTNAKTYTIKSGDTLGQIAGKHSISLSDLMSWNGLSNHLIYPGQVLKVSKSGSKPAPSSPAPAPAPPKQDSSMTSYSVQSGDTLSHIGMKFDVTVAQLKSWNGLSSDFLRIGQVLKVSKSGAKPAPVSPAPAQPAPPKPASSMTSYTVKSGDTLSHIGATFGVSVSDLRNWNSLSSDFLRIGQVLKVKGTAQTIKPPAPSPNQSSSFSVDRLLSEATSHMGTPYVWGGSSVGGFDCSGFIYYVFKEAGAKSVKRLSSEGYYSRSYYVNTPQPGDLVFFENTYKKGISHLGIYIGNNEFIHAGDNGVQVTSLSNSYWKSKFDGFKRFYEL